jgi:uncharacterized C2H2 Zn-finger protein
MPKIRVWNDNTVPYTEEFMDEKITILPGKYRDMEADEANRFCGTFGNGIQLDGMGNPTVESMKMLRKEFIEPLFDDGSGKFGMKATSDDFKCNVCGKICIDQEHLDGHVNAQHLNEMADKTEQSKRMAAINKKR